MISLDTETQGCDMYHGSRPFFVTICYEDGSQKWWQWKVDPLTRKVRIKADDLAEIHREIDKADTIVGQNIRFDVKALGFAFQDLGMCLKWPWQKTHDTLLAGHLLASNQPHDLTSMVLHYLAIDIQPLEKRLEAAVKSARNFCRFHLKEWRIADKKWPDMPSLKSGNDKNEGQGWRFDYWLPNAAWQHCHLKHIPLPKNSEGWEKANEEYSNADSATTLMLWKEMEKRLKGSGGYWNYYLESMKLPDIVSRMESNSVTVNMQRMKEKYEEYKKSSEESAAICRNIAASYGYPLDLPKNGLNGSLRTFCFDTLELPVVARSNKGKGGPSLDKNALAKYLQILKTNTKQYLFIRTLLNKRSQDTACAYIEGYKRFLIPIEEHPGYARIYPNLNITGTSTTRLSSNNPNSQNVGRQSENNLRYMFGPLPDEEWWSIDYENLELRIPAYLAGETAMIELFERPNDPPYYGSYHLLTCHILHPELFESCIGADGRVDGRIFKDRCDTQWYKPAKNGNFAVQYGAMAASGTADRAYRVEGAQLLIESHLSNIKKLANDTLSFANRYGYVETVPDRSVDPEHGYHLLVNYVDTKWGRKVEPTKPLSYKIQGTAGWCAKKAMIRCDKQLTEWREKDGFDGRMILNVHDEIVFRFPRGDNQDRVEVLKRLMQKSGEDIGIPLTVSTKRHLDAWSLSDD